MKKHTMPPERVYAAFLRAMRFCFLCHPSGLA
jgi:hypothetical protein